MDEVRDFSASKEEWECFQKYVNKTEAGFCDVWWDETLCWPPSPPGVSVQPCPLLSSDMEVIGQISNPDIYASRICNSDGQWLSNKTDYFLCLDDPDGSVQIPVIYYVVGYILIIGSVLSLITLAVSLFIFFYFKSLHCSRLKVHRNLCVALILYLISLMIPACTIFFQFGFWQKKWLCRSVMTVHFYSMMASTNWMFLEGLLLHSRVTVHIFKQDAPFKLYYCVGWGFPALMVTIWATVMSHQMEDVCWLNYETSPIIWLVTGPMLIALLTNTLFLVNIIRVLLTRHRGNVTGDETMQVRKAIKATALLFPLLGITHLLFCINPNDNSFGHHVYMVFNSFIKSSQGLFVGILYCFMNSDVQTAIKNAFSRLAIQYNPNHNGRYKVGRGLSQTSNTYMSHSEGMDASSRNKLNSRVTLVLQDTKQSPFHQSVKCGTRLANDSVRTSMV